MNTPEFDQYSDIYDQLLNQSIPDYLNENEYFTEYKIALMASRLHHRKTTRILDLGCGVGRSLFYLKKYFPNTEIWGYDVSPASLRIASELMPSARLFSTWDAHRDIQFDVILAANVFHHIPLDERLASLIHCRKALSPKGQMFLFEHNPYNPITRWVFERCPFDKNAEMITLKTALNLAYQAGYKAEHHAYTLFFPRPLAIFRKLEPWLKHIPLGAQYYIQMT